MIGRRSPPRAMAAGLLSLPALAFGADAAPAAATEYRDVPYVGSRNLVWVVAQLHLLLAGFVLGVPIFAWLCEIVAWKSGEKRYDKLAKEFTKLLTSAYATTALFGGILLFLLISFYPKLMNYLTDIFFPSFIVYCLLFLVETATLYLYWYGWDAMQGGGKKTFHIFLGFLLNFFAFFIMIVPNSWATFQASPVVLAEGSDMARAWAATWNPTWWPVNIHRIIANVVLGGYICGAYAGIRYLSARTRKSATTTTGWDMSEISSAYSAGCRSPLPATGSCAKFISTTSRWVSRLWEASCPGCSFCKPCSLGCCFSDRIIISAGHHHRLPGSASEIQEADVGHADRSVVVPGVRMTPHSLVASMEEARKMGGSHHPLLGVFGVMSAKMTVANLMILVTFMSFIMYWRAGKQETAGWAKVAKAIMGGVLACAAIAVIVLGVWGYFVPAIIRINLFSTSQVLIVLFVMLTITPLTSLLLKSAKTTTEMVWGRMPPRASYSLVLNAVMVILR